MQLFLIRTKKVIKNLHGYNKIDSCALFKKKCVTGILMLVNVKVVSN